MTFFSQKITDLIKFKIFLNSSSRLTEVTNIFWSVLIRIGLCIKGKIKLIYILWQLGFVFFRILAKNSHLRSEVSHGLKMTDLNFFTFVECLCFLWTKHMQFSQSASCHGRNLCHFLSYLIDVERGSPLTFPRPTYRSATCAVVI